MAGHDIVVIGGSAGGVEALRRICAGLPADLPATVFVVLHISPATRSVMPELLSRAGPLPARHPRDEEATSRGTIYVAPPDMHMLLRPGHVILRRGPLESSSRPAIDALFRSAAVAYRSRVIGVVLSGLLDDGSAGLMAIKACGGICVVQEPDDAMWPEMPRNALSHDGVYYRATVADLPALLTRLVSEAPGEMPPIPHHLIVQAAAAAREVATTPGRTQAETPGPAVLRAVRRRTRRGARARDDGVSVARLAMPPLWTHRRLRGKGNWIGRWKVRCGCIEIVW